MASSPTASQQSVGPILSFRPPPHEQSYYDGLFAQADHNQAGAISGAEAVAFLSKSKLPVQLLKNIWMMADRNPRTNSLDRNKFYIAVRLIQLFQNGQKAQGADLSSQQGVNMRPPYFEGFSGVAVPYPSAAPAPGYQSAAPPSQNMPQPQQSQRQFAQQPPPQQQVQHQQPHQKQVPPQQQAQRQQQQQQPPHQQQQQPHQQQQPTNTSNALTAHDPYTMYPHEQARYESLFPNYEKDGYVYGAEAVALFSRSGVPKDKLREVWNLVDDPVDNRLSTLEFAIAMHLIVCISKKNLPVPTSLPASLQALKQRDRTDSVDSHSSEQRTSTQQSPQTHQTMRPAMVQQPSVSYTQQNTPHEHPPVTSQPDMHRPSMSSVEPLGTSVRSGSLVNSGAASGGISISDAFNDLSVEQHGGGYSIPSPKEINLSAAPAPAPVSYEDSQLNGHGSFDQHQHRSSSPPAEVDNSSINKEVGSVSNQTRQYSTTAPTVSFSPTPKTEHMYSVAAPSASAPAPSSEKLAASYKMGNDKVELEKLRKVLQQLQAENIALKAQLSSFSEEEVEVKREIAATVSEIGNLSKELASRRAEVAEAKASLIEATSELKALDEKKSMLKDLISGSQAAREALNTAKESIDDLKISMTTSQPSSAYQSCGNVENDLFGFDDAGPSSESKEDGKQFTSENAGVESQPTNQPVNEPKNVDEGIPTSYYDSHAPLNHDASCVGNFTSASAPAPPNVPSEQDIETLKKNAFRAAEVAAEAEQEATRVALRAEELTRAADEAEREAQEKQAAVEGKKKHFGRGKKGQKVAGKLCQKAAELRNSALEAQSQVTAAQANAMRAKREADTFRQQCEQAEFEAATAASVSDAEAKTKINVQEANQATTNVAESSAASVASSCHVEVISMNGEKLSNANKEAINFSSNGTAGFSINNPHPMTNGSGTGNKMARETSMSKSMGSMNMSMGHVSMGNMSMGNMSMGSRNMSMGSKSMSVGGGGIPSPGNSVGSASDTYENPFSSSNYNSMGYSGQSEAPKQMGTESLDDFLS